MVFLKIGTIAWFTVMKAYIFKHGNNWFCLPAHYNSYRNQNNSTGKTHMQYLLIAGEYTALIQCTSIAVL